MLGPFTHIFIFFFQPFFLLDAKSQYWHWYLSERLSLPYFHVMFSVLKRMHKYVPRYKPQTKKQDVKIKFLLERTFPCSTLPVCLWSILVLLNQHMNLINLKHFPRYTGLGHFTRNDQIPFSTRFYLSISFPFFVRIHTCAISS